MKYIQQSNWFKEGRDKAIKALNKQYHENIDRLIINALGFEKSMLKTEAGGKGSRGCGCL